MTRNTRHALLAVLAMLAPLTASAQEVRDREARQQGRISQGIGSGQITAGGAAHLESREARINSARRADLSANGHLTGREQRNLNRRETALSGQIHTDKHNDVAQPGVVPR